MAVDEHGRRLTFADYRERALRVAAGLSERGVAEGTVVSWQLPTWIESTVLVAALARLGAVQNPILPIYRAREVGFAVRQAGSRLLIVPGVWRGFDYEAMAREIGGPDVLVAAPELPEADPAGLGPPPEPPSSAGDAPVRWIFYTSGTTADPKGVMHTDPSVLATGRATYGPLQLRADDRAGLVFPLTHIGGITSLVQALEIGLANILTEAFDPEVTIDLLAREGVTLPGAGTVFHQTYLAAQRRRRGPPIFSAARAFPGGGAPKPASLHREVKAELGGVGILSGYGLTECPVATLNAVDDPDDKKAESEGRPCRDVRVRIVGLDGAEAAAGEEGEIRVAGPQQFRGYVDGSLDAEAFDEERFVRTGDLGFLDGDGYLVVTGRLKDVIIRKGENVSAREVEELLFVHPGVRDVAVVGVPDPQTGERVAAVVVPADVDRPPDLAELTAFLRDQGLMAQKLPERLDVVDALPRNPSGKVLKHELRARLARDTAPTMPS